MFSDYGLLTAHNNIKQVTRLNVRSVLSTKNNELLLAENVNLRRFFFLAITFKLFTDHRYYNIPVYAFTVLPTALTALSKSTEVSMKTYLQ